MTAPEGYGRGQGAVAQGQRQPGGPPLVRVGIQVTACPERGGSQERGVVLYGGELGQGRFFVQGVGGQVVVWAAALLELEVR